MGKITLTTAQLQSLLTELQTARLEGGGANGWLSDIVTDWYDVYNDIQNTDDDYSGYEHPNREMLNRVRDLEALADSSAERIGNIADVTSNHTSILNTLDSTVQTKVNTAMSSLTDDVEDLKKYCHLVRVQGYLPSSYSNGMHTDDHKSGESGCFLCINQVNNAEYIVLAHTASHTYYTSWQDSRLYGPSTPAYGVNLLYPLVVFDTSNNALFVTSNNGSGLQRVLTGTEAADPNDASSG